MGITKDQLKSTIEQVKEYVDLQDGVEISYSDYLKLSDEEKDGNITYFIPDYPEEEENVLTPELLLDKISETHVYDIDVTSYNDYYIDLSINGSVSLPFYILSMEIGKKYRCAFVNTVYADLKFREDGKVEIGVVPGDYEKLYITIYGMKKSISTMTNDIVDSLDSTDTDKALSANMGRELKEELDDCFQSVSDGKELVASAITGKGVTTDATATFEQMATNISSIKTTAIPTAGNKNTKTGSHTGYSSSSATPSITLPANGTYIVTFVACQGSKEGYAVNSSFAVGNFSVSGTNLVENAVVAGYDNQDPSQKGTARLYSQSILVNTGSSSVTISRTATAGGYGGNVIATIYAIKIG